MIGRRGAPSLSLMAVISLVHLSFAAQQSQLLRQMPLQTWDATVESLDLEYEYLSAAISRSKPGVWVVLGVRPRGMLSGPQRWEFDRFDNDGKRTDVIAWDDIRKSLPVALSKFYGIATDRSDRLYVFGQASAGLAMVRYDPSGRTPVVFRSIAGLYSSMFVAKVLMVPDDQFLLLGHVDSRAVALQVDSTAQIVSEAKLSGEVNTLLTGVFERGVGFVAGARIDGLKAARLWLGRMPADGVISHSIGVPGSRVSVAPHGGGVALLHNASSTGLSGLRLAAYSGDLSLLWERTLATSVSEPIQLALAAARDGQLLAVWEEKRSVTLVALRRDGAVTTTGRYEDLNWAWQRLWNLDVVSFGEDTIMPMTLLIVDEKKEQRQVVRLFLFRR